MDCSVSSTKAIEITSSSLPETNKKTTSTLTSSASVGVNANANANVSVNDSDILAAQTLVANNDFSASLATMTTMTMDGIMFDVLSDSILEAGLFSVHDDVPTPIKGNYITMKTTEVAKPVIATATTTTAAAAAASTCMEPNIAIASNGTTGSGSGYNEVDAVVNCRVNTKKRRLSFIPTVRGSRKSIFIAEDIFEEPAIAQQIASSDTDPKHIAVPVATQATTKSSIVSKPVRKSLFVADESESVATNQENWNPQILRSQHITAMTDNGIDPTLTKKSVSNTSNSNMDRRKSLATISSMLNSITGHTATALGAGNSTSGATAAHVQTRSRTSLSGNDIAPTVAIRSSTRRKSILG